MTQPSFSESLLIQHPQLQELSSYYEELGFEEPIQWAYSEMTGEAAVATAALVHALGSEVCRAGDHAWAGLMQSGSMNVGNAAIAAQAAEALAGLAAQGVDLSSLTPVIRAVQAQVVRNIATLLDEGPETCCIPLPAGREAGWEISGTATRDGMESPAQRILGIYGIIDGSGRI